MRRKINMIGHVKEEEQELLNFPNVVTEKEYVTKDDFEILTLISGDRTGVINRKMEVNRKIGFWWI